MVLTEKILLVDDEAGLLDLLKITLQKERYQHIFCAGTAAEALELIKKNSFDLIILDVMLPDFSGFDLCSEIRKYTYAPIIFITACGSDYDKLNGLAIGGDDYITKPFNPLEVIARVKAILRRQNQYSGKLITESEQVYDFGTFTVDIKKASLVVNGVSVLCTAKEFELLIFFCKHPNRVFTSSQIYEAVWDELGIGDEKTVAMHISKLRKKLGDDPKDSKIIVNLRGIGYKFTPLKKAGVL